MTDAAAIMDQHFAYWTRFEEHGIVVVLGPVLDPSGMCGLPSQREVPSRHPIAASMRERSSGW
jgi:hypothetical protein